MFASSSTISRVGMASGSSQGEADAEGRAARRRGVDRDGAAVLVDDALDDREAEAAAVGLGRVAGHEEARLLLGVEPRAVVGDNELERAVEDGGVHAHAAAAIDGVEAIADQVAERLPDLAGV